MTLSQNWKQNRPIPAVLLAIVLGSAGLKLVGRHTAGIGALPEILSSRKDLTQELRAQVSAADGRPEGADLKRFYDAAGFLPVWVEGNALSERGEAAVMLLKSAGVRGLQPEDYASGLAVLKANSDVEAVRLDVAVTTNLLSFTNDVRNGRWNPGIYASAKESPKAALGDVLWSVATDPAGVEAGIEKLDPPFEDYRRLVTALAAYQEQAKADPSKLAQVHEIERTMERWRWLPREFDRGPILVNIPEFQLRAWDASNHVALQMRVAVGKGKTPTPLFTSDMQYLIFGPYWNVPSSILQKELIPDINKDRGYLSKNSYEAVDGAGKVVAEDEVSEETLAGLKTGKLRVRQVPGGKNALGRVKFLFPNQNDVYLHDTNSRSVFGLAKRDVSHGCVRVQKPEELAAWVLRDQPEWTRERIAEALKDTDTQRANLKTPIPVYMLYHTVTVGDDGEVHFWRDIYKEDAELAARMMAGKS
ncbi:MAG: L,D-transpeptidase family protein [Acidobacteriota bacterium]